MKSFNRDEAYTYILLQLKECNFVLRTTAPIVWKNCKLGVGNATRRTCRSRGWSRPRWPRRRPRTAGRAPRRGSTLANLAKEKANTTRRQRYRLLSVNYHLYPWPWVNVHTTYHPRIGLLEHIRKTTRGRNNETCECTKIKVDKKTRHSENQGKFKTIKIQERRKTTSK